MKRTFRSTYRSHSSTDQYTRIRNEIMQMISRTVWRAPVAATFTLKQGLPAGTLGPQQTGPVFLSEQRASRNLRHALNVVNRGLFGNAASRYGRALRVFSLFERSGDGRLHIHSVIDRPDWVSWREFHTMLSAAWRATHWGDREICLNPDVDQGWLEYMLKLRSKADLLDSIDWENVHLPADC